MLGWFSEEIARASRSKRCFASGFSERCDGRILTATVRSRRVSRARYTSPIPPAPSGDWISYGPSLAPEARDISGLNYKQSVQRFGAITAGKAFGQRRTENRPAARGQPRAAVPTEGGCGVESFHWMEQWAAVISFVKFES